MRATHDAGLGLAAVVLGMDGLWQVGAILAQPTLDYDLVTEVQEVQGLINTVCVEDVTPELLQRGQMQFAELSRAAGGAMTSNATIQLGDPWYSINK